MQEVAFFVVVVVGIFILDHDDFRIVVDQITKLELCSV